MGRQEKYAILGENEAKVVMFFEDALLGDVDGVDIVEAEGKTWVRISIQKLRNTIDRTKGRMIVHRWLQKLSDWGIIHKRHAYADMNRRGMMYTLDFDRLAKVISDGKV